MNQRHPQSRHTPHTAAVKTDTEYRERIFPKKISAEKPENHPGVLAAKVRDFGSNLLKCYSSRWAPNLLKSATWLLAPSNVLKCAPGGGKARAYH